MSLVRQIGRNKWNDAITYHLNKTYPRSRTVVEYHLTGWLYVIQDSPNNCESLQLKSYFINNIILDIDSPTFGQDVNDLLDNNNILAVTNVSVST
jgi:hypothetical protein